MAYRRSYGVNPLTAICLLWTFTGVGAVIGYNLTGSLQATLVIWLAPTFLGLCIESASRESKPPTRVYFGPRGGAYRINANGRKSYDVTEEEIRRSREYYDKPEED